VKGLRAIALALVLALATMGAAAAPRGTIVDTSTQACSVSYDGVVWYDVPAGAFPPIDVRQSTCDRSALGSDPAPARPAWAIPRGTTQTRFIATSLQEAYSAEGMASIENAAAPYHIPVTWMIGSFKYFRDYMRPYRSYHTANGDDVETTSGKSLIRAVQYRFKWYVPMVGVEGAGKERNIPELLAIGEDAFWGIAWNSHGVDRTFDYGAPWGSYCADPGSYKRPQPDGGCTLLAFEWTARDLTRAYLSEHEEYFSTDPDDLLLRARFTPEGAQTYVRAIADAYAAAGETQPMVMMSQQESDEDTAPGDADILDALYSQAAADGMKAETLAQAAVDARTFSAAPRAIAFPYIPGGVNVKSRLLNGQKLYPATIDYHDAQAGMTFLCGHTVPTRVFRYADFPQSFYNVPFSVLPDDLLPTLSGAVADKGVLTLSFEAPQALHYGIALWSDPAILQIRDAHAVPAGRAGVVVTFDLQAGANQVAIRCAGCGSTTLPYAK
jgi:hypothetical protein